MRDIGLVLLAGLAGAVGAYLGRHVERKLTIRKLRRSIERAWAEDHGHAMVIPPDQRRAPMGSEPWEQ